MRFLLLLLLIGCAASRPSEYRDGAPVRTPVVPPRVGHTPAGAGLPEYFREPERQPLPRSPHRRPLPPTAEPGIWAGDEPKASADRYPRPIVLGTEQPTAEDSTAAEKAKACADQLTMAAASTLGIAQVYNLPPPTKACLAARLQQFCLVTRRQQAENDKSSDLPAWHSAFVVATRHEERVCKDARYGNDAARHYKEIVDSWFRVSRVPNHLR